MEREDNRKELSELQDYLWDEWNLLSSLFCTAWVVCDHEMSRKNGLMKPWDVLSGSAVHDHSLPLS